ncbi:MAG: ABC transporter ATP-binding protein [Candidatus Saccharimonadales bacterium]
MSTARQTVHLFWQHAWRYPHYVIGLAIAVPATILVHQFLPPLIAATVLERISKGDFESGDLWSSFGTDLALYAALVIVGGSFAWRIVIWLIWKLEMLVVRDIHQRVFSHLLDLSANFHANRFGGSLVSQANKLAGAYIRIADTTVFQITTMILAFAFTAIILLPRAPLFVALLLLFSVIFMTTAVLVTKRVRELNAAEAKASNTQTGYLADSVTNVMAVKGFAAGNYERERYAKATEAARAATTQVMRASLKRDTYFGSVTSGIDALALTLAAASVVFFQADIATVFLVLTYTGNIVKRLWDFCQSTLRNYNRALGDARDMVQTLAIEPGVKDPTKPEPVRITKGSITFKDVSFTHADEQAGNSLFKNLDLAIKPGEKIGLVGHSGSGKTTLTKLLLRFADINKGEILIDGQNIAKIAQDDLRRHIAYVPQEPLLFHRTIKENIAYGKPDATDDEIKEAARRANAAEFIEKLPHGYGTLVGERGVKLSGGQRQRVAIARAILKDAPILVLDEATSALDSESEKLIQAALWELMEGRTAIVIAHRLSTIQRMDRIIVLEHGQITEQGNHSELLKNGNTYAELWAHQSGGFIDD